MHPVALVRLGLMLPFLGFLPDCASKPDQVDRTGPLSEVSTEPPEAFQEALHTHYQVDLATLANQPIYLRYHQGENEPQAIASAMSKISQRVTELYSRLDQDNPLSDISRLNNSEVGSWVSLDPDVTRALDRARRLNQLTGGAFDIAIGPVFALYRFDQQEHSELPSHADIKAALRLTGADAFTLDAANSRAKRNYQGVSLNLSALIDGSVIDRGIEVAQEFALTGVSVSFSGESRVIPHKEPGLFFPFTISDPRAKQRGGILIRRGAVSASGDSERFFTAQGRRYSHILDPTTGMPTESGVYQVYVFADECWLSDGLSTAFVAMGIDRAKALLASLKGVDAFILLEGADQQRVRYQSPGIVRLDTGAFLWSPDRH